MKESIFPLVYIHLPKCGGTTVHAMVWRLYKHHSIANESMRFCDSFEIPRVLYEDKTSGASHLKDCDVVVGHVAFGLADDYNEQHHPFYIVTMRHPVDRVLSLYKYVLKNEDHFQHN